MTENGYLPHHFISFCSRSIRMVQFAKINGDDCILRPLNYLSWGLIIQNKANYVCQNTDLRYILGMLCILGVGRIAGLQ